ncbi:MAG: universal stress protein [Burkholderiaceae bacterium]
MLRRVLLAVDGSEVAARVVNHVIQLRGELRQPGDLQVHLVNVQRPLPGEVGRFVGGQTIEDYHAERSEQALAPARAALDAAGLAHQDHRRVGEPGPSIAALARETGCDMIVMGTRGLGAPTGALLGSVAQATLEAAAMPVLLIR